MILKGSKCLFYASKEKPANQIEFRNMVIRTPLGGAVGKKRPCIVKQIIDACEKTHVFIRRSPLHIKVVTPVCGDFEKKRICDPFSGEQFYS